MNVLEDKKYFINFKMLMKYCEDENFKGWDPYDGLSSYVFNFFHLDKIKFFRLAWIQLFKRNPINLRKIFMVPKGYNPKGLGLFLTAYCNLYKIEQKKEYLNNIYFLADKIIELQTPDYSGACWGYDFDWQSRAFFLKKGTPTVVATSFISSSLLDAYDITKNRNYLNVAESSAKFFMNDLNRIKKEEGFIFSYSPYDHTCVYNASLLGSKILARIYSYNHDAKLLKVARESIIACSNAQKADGSWIYGELNMQTWVDSFHTGYNIECIVEYQKFSGDNSFDTVIEKGLNYYLNNFFLDDGTPKYYDNKIYPIDIHAPSQFIVTLYRAGILQKHKIMIDKILSWSIENMQDKKDGFFYYQLKQNISSKIPYMRWAQAWMFYAFSFYYLQESENE